MSLASVQSCNSSPKIHGAQLILGEDEVFLSGFGFQSFEPFTKGFQIVAQPDAPHSGGETNRPRLVSSLATRTWPKASPKRSRPLPFPHALRPGSWAGLDVAVDDPSGMSGFECVGDVNRQTEQNIGVDGLSRDAILQRHPVQKLHGDERLPILLADIKNHANIGVIQRGGNLGFALKTSEGLRVFGHFFRHEFEGDKTVETNILGLINNTHTATAELLDDAVVRDGLADHERAQEAGLLYWEGWVNKRHKRQEFYRLNW